LLRLPPKKILAFKEMVAAKDGEKIKVKAAKE
jgi:hypothetical protein